MRLNRLQFWGFNWLPVFVLLVPAPCKSASNKSSIFCTREYTVRTGKIHYVEIGGHENLLYYAYDKPIILVHPCHSHIALFLGKTVFLTTNYFESSLKPLFAPRSLQAELLQGNFDKTMHILDMSDTLHLYGVMVPQPTQNPIPIITISNPHSLGLKLKMYEDGYTYDGNIKFKINITLMQQYLSGKAHDSFISNIKVPSLSTITLDLIDRGLSCIDLQPPTGLISIGCNWAKKIIIRNTLNACTKDILTPVELQKNYTYILEKGTYDPSFNSRLRLDLQDQAVIYDYEELGCPQLVYFNNPWKPVIELWEGSRFVEVVTTEFVLMEKNGMHTYNYSKNVGGANCKSQAQNWTSVMAASTTKNYLAWTREIYVTCHELNHSIPLLWPDLEYQILGGRTDNSIIFQERNGFYIFHLTIVDPFYSYCDLTTSFAIYVYGAFPQRLLPDYPLALLVMLSMLFILWLGYVIPKLSSTEKGRVIIGFFQELWNPFMKREKRKRPSHR
uniref:Cation channel sperm associated auxiliary subunit delta n=1 Tax=Monodelphis domestica TaxID=13616 RepID=A0A5F8GRP5_MONDO